MLLEGGGEIIVRKKKKDRSKHAFSVDYQYVLTLISLKKKNLNLKILKKPFMQRATYFEVTAFRELQMHVAQV